MLCYQGFLLDPLRYVGHPLTRMEEVDVVTALTRRYPNFKYHPVITTHRLTRPYPYPKSTNLTFQQRQGLVQGLSGMDGILKLHTIDGGAWTDTLFTLDLLPYNDDTVRVYHHALLQPDFTQMTAPIASDYIMNLVERSTVGCSGCQ